MATRAMVLDCLEEFSVNFNRGRNYQDIMEARWISAFKDTPDDCLLRVVQKILETPFQFPPTLGDVVGAATKQVADLLGKVGSGKSVRSYNFCQECEERQGVVSTAAHYIWIGDRDDDHQRGEYRVSVSDTLCGCEGSIEYRGRGMRPWSMRRKLFQDDTRVQLQSFHATCFEMPYLKGVDSSGKYFDHTMKLDDFEEIQERVHKRAKGALPSTSFTRVVSLLGSGDPIALQALLEGDGRVVHQEPDPWDTEDDLDYE